MKIVYGCCIIWLICIQELWASEPVAEDIGEINTLATNLQIGSYQGWDIFLENYVESDIAGYSFYQIAPKILSEVYNNELSVERFGYDLTQFSEYLIKLFSETLLEQGEKLQRHQLIELFNLAHDVNFSRLDDMRSKSFSSNPVASLVSIKPKLIASAKRIEEYYQSKLNCPVKMQWQRIKNKPLLSIKLVVVEELEGSSVVDYLACFNRIDSRLDRAEMLWVNEIKVRSSAGNSMKRLRQEAKKLLSLELKENTNYNPLGINGFSTGMLFSLAEKVSKLYYKSGGGQLSTEQEAILINDLAELYRSRGLTFTRLTEIADKLKEFYRSKGFILSTVYVPEQKFINANGIVYLSSQSGVLGKVKLNSDNDLAYRDEIVSDIFHTYLGKGVNTDISDTYYKLGLLPGLSVKSGFFEVGDKPGETNLIVDVDRNWGDVSIIGDNYGSTLTGKYRALTAIAWHNPVGHGDDLSLGYLYGFNPEKTQLGYLKYQYPLILPTINLGLTYESNTYSALKTFAGNTPVHVEGQAENRELSVKHTLITHKDMNARLNVRANKKSSIVNSTFMLTTSTPSNSRSELSDIYSVGFYLDFLLNSVKTAVLIDTHASIARVHKASELNIDNKFSKFSTSLNTSTLLSFNHHFKSKLSVYLKASYSDHALPSYEQFSIGGADKVKAFSSSIFLGDSGIYTNIEWTADVFDYLFSRQLGAAHKLDVGIYAEQSFARLNGFDEAPSVSARINGYGGLLRYDWRRKLIVDTSISFTGNRFSEEDYKFLDDGENGKVLINVRYTF